MVIFSQTSISELMQKKKYWKFFTHCTQMTSDMDCELDKQLFYLRNNIQSTQFLQPITAYQAKHVRMYKHAVTVARSLGSLVTSEAVKLREGCIKYTQSVSQISQQFIFFPEHISLQ
jgi:hypothetical protein